MITVFGSANMDLVAYVERAPELGETVSGREFRTICGGKGANQAIASALAGGDVRFVGAVGSDGFGAELREALDRSGVDTRALRTVDGPSGIAHIVVEDGGANSIIVVPGANGEVSEEDARTVSANAPQGRSAAGRTTDALLLQLELPMPAVVAAARAFSGLVVLTPAPVVPLPRELLDAVGLLLPNEHEAAAITGLTAPEEALEALLALVPEAVVTLGADGAIYGSRDGSRLRVPGRPVEAVDTTAAGDTFAGAFTVARTEGRTAQEALEFATAAAALSVQRPGASTSMPTREEIDAEVR
ncbi:ribokinase [Herbidospora sp. NBRC 101105]|uniref:ribokinase n=1 Tax=Herbidospora sp. NBRC 101105 TaxID=3032195 RepID=UPI0024A34808|nr:ribokinase [Herbidospora sp. NBRC 101105]GLX94101.1 ribokinase [Herbidospora sp. NBRC 101105]